MKKLFIIILCSIALIGCGSGSTAAFDKDNAITVFDTEIGKVFTDTNSEKGKSVIITGQVFQILDDNKVMLYYSPDTSENNYIVQLNSDMKVQEKENLIINGVVTGTETYKNQLGTDVTVPLIKADSIEKTTIYEVVAPSQKTVNVNKTITKSNISVTLQKIEFAKNETRAFVQINNNTTGEMDPDQYNSKLIVNGNQYKYNYTYVDGYETLDDSIVAKAKDSGVLTFSGVSDYENKKASIVINFYDMDYNTISFTFDTTVK